MRCSSHSLQGSRRPPPVARRPQPCAAAPRSRGATRAARMGCLGLTAGQRPCRAVRRTRRSAPSGRGASASGSRAWHSKGRQCKAPSRLPSAHTTHSWPVVAAGRRLEPEANAACCLRACSEQWRSRPPRRRAERAAPFTRTGAGAFGVWQGGMWSVVGRAVVAWNSFEFARGLEEGLLRGSICGWRRLSSRKIPRLKIARGHMR